MWVKTHWLNLEQTFQTYLTTQNFVQSPVDPCIYVQNVHNQILIVGRQYINIFKN